MKKEKTEHNILEIQRILFCNLLISRRYFSIPLNLTKNHALLAGEKSKLIWLIYSIKGLLECYFYENLFRARKKK